MYSSQHNYSVKVPGLKAVIGWQEPAIRAHVGVRGRKTHPGSGLSRTTRGDPFRRTTEQERRELCLYHDLGMQSPQDTRVKQNLVLQFTFHFFVYLLIDMRSCYVVQTSLELKILLPQPHK